MAKMTKEERGAWSIAKKFAAAVKELEAFTGNPNMVLEEIRFEARRAPKKEQDTLFAIHKALCSEDAGED